MFASVPSNQDRSDSEGFPHAAYSRSALGIERLLASSLSKLCFGLQDGGERENEHAEGANGGWLMVSLPWAGWLDGRTSQKR